MLTMRSTLGPTHRAEKLRGSVVSSALECPDDYPIRSVVLVVNLGITTKKRKMVVRRPFGSERGEKSSRKSGKVYTYICI